MDLLRTMQATLETRGQTVSELSHPAGITAQKVEHGLGNLGAALDAIARWIDRQRDREHGLQLLAIGLTAGLPWGQKMGPPKNWMEPEEPPDSAPKRPE